MPIHKDYEKFEATCLSKGISHEKIALAIQKNEVGYEAYIKAFWESLSDIGVGVGWDKTLASDFRLEAIYTNNSVAHQLISRNANAVSANAWSIYKEEDDAEYTKRTHKLVKRATRKGVPRRTKAAFAKRNGLKHRYKDANKVEEIVGHELADFLTNDIEGLSCTDMIGLLARYIQIFGKAYLQLIKSSPDAKPVGVRMLKPYLMYPQRSWDGTVYGYFYTNVYGPPIGGAPMPQLYDKVELDVNDVVVMRWCPPSDPYGGGDSPLRSAYTKVGASMKFDELLTDMLNNRARIDGMFIPGTDMGPDYRDKLEKDFHAKFSGSGNQKVLFVDSPNSKFVPISYPPADLAALKVNESLRIELHNALYVPLAMSDSPQGLGDGGIESSLEQWAREALTTIGSVIEDAFNKHLVPLFDDSGAFFAFDEWVPEDAEFELDKDKAIAPKLLAMKTSGVFTVNEIRWEAGCDPIPGGDTVEGVIDPDADSDADSTQDDTDNDTNDTNDTNASNDDGAADGGESPETEHDEEAEKSLDLDAILKLNAAVHKGKISRARAINTAVAVYGIDQEQARQLIDERAVPKEVSLAKAIQPSETTIKELEKEVRKFASKQHQDFLKQIGKAKKDFTEALVTKAEGDPDPDPDNLLPEEFVALESWNDDLAYRVQPLIEVQAKASGDNTVESLIRAGASPDVFAVLPANISKAIDQRALKLAQSTNDTTLMKANDALAALKTEMKEGLFAGDPVPELTGRVQSIFTQLADYRAEAIARTEASAAVHIGQIVAAKDSGIVKSMKPLISADACDICADYEGDEKAIDDMDVSGALDAEQPPYHPNCRCTLTEEIDFDKVG